MRPQEITKKLGLISWFTSNSVAANMLMVLLICSGIFAISNMKKETFPNIDPKIISISTPYPGSNPQEVEEGIIKPIEEVLIPIDGIKKVTSQANENFGISTIEVERSANIDDVYNDISTAISSIKNFPPKNSEQPIINKFKQTPLVLMVALFGDVSEKTLRVWAENIKEDIKIKTGISLIKINGLKEYEISVEISEKKLQEYNVSLAEVSNLINEFSSDIPLGNIESKKGDILFRIQEKLLTGKELKNLIIRSDQNGAKLYLKDIANIKDAFTERNISSLYNGKKTAILQIRRGQSQDSLEVANAVKNYIKTLSLPTSLKLEIISDDTLMLKDRINLIIRNGLIGFVLVFLILLIFIDLKLAFWTSIAIPVTMLGGLFLYSLTGHSINMVSLFGLIVVLGIVVDDAIVVGESIFEEQNKNPGNKYAILGGVKNVMSPVTVGVLTTVAAFLPLCFGEGNFSQIIKVIPLVVIPILLISLIEAFFILPSHLSKNTRWSRGLIFKIRNSCKKNLENFTQNTLSFVVTKSIQYRYLTITILICFGILTIATLKGGHIGFVFFPEIEGDEIRISLTMPKGTPYKTTNKNIIKIQNAANKVNKKITKEQNGNSPFKLLLLNSGFQINRGGGPEPTLESSSNNIAQIYIKLTHPDNRDFSAKQIENMIRKETGLIANAKELSFRSSMIAQKNDIELELSYPDEKTLTKIVTEIDQKLHDREGIYSISNSLSLGKEEYIFKLNKKGLALGLTPSEMGRQLRGAFFGIEVKRIQRQNSEVTIYVRYPKSKRISMEEIYKSRIRLKNGEQTSIKDVAKIEKTRGLGKINRINGRRVALITARINKDIVNLDDSISEIKKNIISDLTAKHHLLSFNFEGEKKEQDKSMAEVNRNIIIALILIYVLLSASMRSYFQPFIILAAVPFGFFGAVWGHFLLGYPLTFISMFGIVALIGVLVNASIVLLDFFNKTLANQNISIEDASITTIRRRFRPILLTTISTCAGLLPILFETSLQARFLIPMVISLSIGILFSTFVILFLVPSLLKITDDVNKLFRKES